MHINGDGLCSTCVYFRHECPSWSDSDEMGCMEWCEHDDEDVREQFLDATDDIMECVGYERDGRR